MHNDAQYLEENYYCPNVTCQNHINPRVGFFIKKGRYQTKKSEKKYQLYRCKDCKKIFSETSFNLHYRHRSLEGTFKTIFESSSQGLSNRAIARNLGVSENNVRNKIKHLMRQSLLHWEKKASKLEIKEEVAFDGFETFVYSQYNPNNINHAVGNSSLYLYDFNYVHLNRKGRLTSKQKERLDRIVKQKGRYQTNLVRSQTRKVVLYLTSILHGKSLKLNTDEHKSYELAIKQDLSNFPIIHKTTNSKKTRDGRNPLYPINHLDMKLRHFLKSCTRETIAFNKNEMGLIDRYVLFSIQKNFLRSKFIKGRKETRTESPAMLVGIAYKIFNFYEFFSKRLTSFQVKLREEWKNYYFRIVEHSKLKIKKYCGA